MKKTFLLITIMAFNYSCGQGIKKHQDKVYSTLMNFRYCLFSIKEETSTECYLPYNKTSYSEKSKYRLLKLLNNEWDTTELNNIAKHIFFENIDSKLMSIEKIISDTMGIKKESRRYLQFTKLKDSLLQIKKGVFDDNPVIISRINKNKENIKKYPVENKIIYLSAIVEDEIFISALKNLTVKKANNHDAVELALARLGENKYRESALQKLEEEITSSVKLKYRELRYLQYYKIMPKALFICNQESIKIYAKLLNVDTLPPINDEEYVFYPISYYALNDLVKIIMNEDFRTKFAKLDINDINFKDINWAKEWIEKNHEKMILDESFIPNMDKL